MTIRYKCKECDSVLKIRDELAGTKAKCPKCKTSFTIPEPSVAAEDVNTADESAAIEDPIDMPRELTPLPDLSRKNADTADGLTNESPSAAAESKPEELKPSVAELMREHEEKQKKKKDKKKKGGLAEAAAAADIVTSGTAADALTRNYDQKRGKASEAPPMTREERREAEQKEAMLRAAKRFSPILIAVAAAIYFMFSLAFREPLPDLEYVTGVVTISGAPAEGLEVVFAPVDADKGRDKKDSGQKNSSTAITDSAGKFILMYNPDTEGAIPGKHRVSISTSSGVLFNLDASLSERTVSAENDNVFDFKL